MNNHEETNILSKFSESFNELLGDRDIKDFSQTVGITLSVLYRYKKGKQLPTLQNAIILADVFCCSLDYLFGLTDNASYIHKTAPMFSKAFQNILSENNCTRYRLGQTKKFSTKSLNDWFNGKYPPSIDNVLKLADYFHCTLDHLVGRD